MPEPAIRFRIDGDLDLKDFQQLLWIARDLLEVSIAVAVIDSLSADGRAGASIRKLPMWHATRRHAEAEGRCALIPIGRRGEPDVLEFLAYWELVPPDARIPLSTVHYASPGVIEIICIGYLATSAATAALRKIVAIYGEIESVRKTAAEREKLRAEVQATLAEARRCDAEAEKLKAEAWELRIRASEEDKPALRAASEPLLLKAADIEKRGQRLRTNAEQTIERQTQLSDPTVIWSGQLGAIALDRGRGTAVSLERAVVHRQITNIEVIEGESPAAAPPPDASPKPKPTRKRAGPRKSRSKAKRV